MFEIDPSNFRGDDQVIYLVKQMHTNTLRVILQHTMDNVVSQYVLTHEASVERKTLLSIDADFSAPTQLQN